MKLMKAAWLLVALVVVAVAATRQPQTPAPPQDVRWEYMVRLADGMKVQDKQAQLSALAAEGWELVALAVYTQPEYKPEFYLRRRLAPKRYGDRS